MWTPSDSARLRLVPVCLQRSLLHRFACVLLLPFHVLLNLVIMMTVKVS